MPTDTPETLRSRAEALIEHYPGEHKAIDDLAATGLVPHRHDTIRALRAKADEMEREADHAVRIAEFFGGGSYRRG